MTGEEGEIEKLKNFMLWDVSNGVGRRGWAGGKNAQFYAKYLMDRNDSLLLTLPNEASSTDLKEIFE